MTAARSELPHVPRLEPREADPILRLLAELITLCDGSQHDDIALAFIGMAPPPLLSLRSVRSFPRPLRRCLTAPLQTDFQRNDAEWADFRIRVAQAYILDSHLLDAQFMILYDGASAIGAARASFAPSHSRALRRNGVSMFPRVTDVAVYLIVQLLEISIIQSTVRNERAQVWVSPPPPLIFRV
jgi:hypothetical protein